MNASYRVIFGTLVLGLCGAVFAAGDLQPLKTYGNVSYVTGGIGLDESETIKAAEKDFTLSLLFAQTKRGEFLSDVNVMIKDKAGKAVLEAQSDGPMLLVRLPAGTYQVNAEYEGKSLMKSVRVADKGVTRVGFVWQPTAKATME